MNANSKDLKNVIKRESRFATLAKQEAKGAAQRAKDEGRRGFKESAADSRWETQVDNEFVKIRRRKARKAKERLRGKNG